MKDKKNKLDEHALGYIALFALLMMLSAYSLIIGSTNWRVGLGVFLAIFSNSIFNKYWGKD